MKGDGIMINLDLLTQSVIDRCLARGADAVKCSVSLDEKREFNALFPLPHSV